LGTGPLGRDIDRKDGRKWTWVVGHRYLLAKGLEGVDQAGDRPKLQRKSSISPRRVKSRVFGTTELLIW
jgi:hypothetical protein